MHLMVCKGLTAKDSTRHPTHCWSEEHQSHPHPHPLLPIVNTRLTVYNRVKIPAAVVHFTTAIKVMCGGRKGGKEG